MAWLLRRLLLHDTGLIPIGPFLLSLLHFRGQGSFCLVDFRHILFGNLHVFVGWIVALHIFIEDFNSLFQILPFRRNIIFDLAKQFVDGESFLGQPKSLYQLVLFGSGSDHSERLTMIFLLNSRFCDQSIPNTSGEFLSKNIPFALLVNIRNLIGTV